MARVSIDPTEIKKHPKFHAFRKKLDWPSHHAFGFLCAFWGEVANTEANESGDISDWTPDYLADRISLNIDDPNRLWEALVPGYIETRQNDRVFVRDWLEIFGPALRQKYHNTDRQKLIDIWSAYGRIYGRESKQNRPDGEGMMKGNPSTSFSIEKEVNAIDPENRRISDPGGPPPGPSPEENDRNSAFSPSWETDGEKAAHPPGAAKSTLGFQTAGKAPAAVTLLQTLFVEKLAAHFETPVPAVEATFNYGAAGNGFKKLLNSGLTVTDIEERFAPWFDSTDSFVVRRGYRIEDFFSNFNSLKNGPIANQAGTNGKRPFYDGAATVRAE